MRNVGENVDTTKNLTPFTSDYQPSSEAKKAGWERRRVKQEIMDMITKLRNLSVKDFEDLEKDVKENPDRHTILEKKMIQYIKREKFTIDFLDRNVGKPSQDIDITTKGEGITKYTFEIVNAKDNNEQSSEQPEAEGREDNKGNASVGGHD